MVGKITCHTLEELAIVCAELARQQVVFTADTVYLTIELTGAH
jgi:hypothetical protein